MNQKTIQFFKKLNSLPEESSAAEKRKRGRDFEKLLRMILEDNNMMPELSFRPKGEEIDGSFLLNDRIFLLEAKWHKKSLPASSTYAFKGKVDGKLIGTIGIFISMSGFSKDAVDALSLGKTLNIILFDKNDIEASLKIGNSFKEILMIKLRKAAERGLVYYPIISTQLNYHKSKSQPESKDIETNKISSKEKLSIICEGKSDIIIIEALIKKIIGNNVFDNQDIVIVAANSKMQVPKLGNEIIRLIGNKEKVVYIIDGDQRKDETEKLFLNQGLDLENVIIPNPSIEKWLGMNENQRHLDFYRENRIRRNDKVSLTELVNKIDLKKLSEIDSEFSKFEAIIKKKLKTKA
jgi:hypothetical protein